MAPMNATTMDGYIRVSRRNGRDGETYMSPRLQREAIERWAEYQGVAITAWHVDEDVSGGDKLRPGLDAARARVLAGETGGIVAWKIDRFSRNTVQGLEDLELLDSAGARLAFVVEQVDTATPAGRVVYTILLAISTAFLENVKSTWDAVQERAVMERGAFVGPTPFGYVRVKDRYSPRAGALDVDAETGPIVTEAFELAARLGIQEAASYLREAWPARAWKLDEVRRMLGKDAYLGISRARHHVNDEAHVALTTAATWTAAQTDPRARREVGNYPLSGLMRCDCGGELTGWLQSLPDGRTYRRYRCATCHRCAINADKVEAFVRAALEPAVADTRAEGRRELADIKAAEIAVDTAERLEAEYLGDAELQSTVGRGAYLAGAAKRAGQVQAARERFRALATEESRTATLWLAEELDDDEQLVRFLRAVGGRITVRQGRGRSVKDLSDRVSIRWGVFEDEAPAGALAA